jgi:hypothetical protein
MAKHLPLITRLTRQLSADNVPDARDEALRILRERGHVHKNSEKLTKAGQEREAMGPAKRAIDRASKQSGRPASDYKYVGGRAVLK